MQLRISRDFFDNPKPPEVYLCDTSRKILGELRVTDLQGDFKWNAYSEIKFVVHRTYVDIISGHTVVNPLFDKVEAPRNIYVKNIGYFTLQDIDTTYSDGDEKQVTAFSLEYICGQKYLENFRINTGELDSKEVLYLETVYGKNYTPDKNNLYKKATGSFDPYQSYYIKEYTDSDSYTYVQTTINDEDEYVKYDGTTVEKTLYVPAYPNICFYHPTEPKLSLLNLIFEKVPEWQIGNVDATLWHKERKFDEERIAVYDFLMNDVCDTFNCVIEWDTIHGVVNFYEEAEDGITEDNTVQTRWETDVFVSRENLANEINIKYSSDDIKTKLKVSGADNLDIREVNLGKNYIMNLSYYHNLDWMEQDLYDAYNNYLDTVEKYTTQYTATMQNWVAANNRYNDLMNAVPAEGNVVLIGDQFKKLYCLYQPLYTEGSNQETIDKAVDNAVKTLEKKLNLYHVAEDTKANKPDNILLKLKNTNSDIATIRIYNAGTESSPHYIIQSVVVGASSGITEKAREYTMTEWINGELTAEKMGFDKYTVQYIGTMGAYLVLAKDETKEATLEEYGVNLLKEKHKTYVTIFQTQLEAMFSHEKYQCIVQDEKPDGDYDVGTKWLDTNSKEVILREYDGTKWKIISVNVSKDDQNNYENYERYIENYNKLVAVQKVLLEKEERAVYMSNGFAIKDRNILLDVDATTLENNLHNVATQYFSGYTVKKKGFDAELPLYIFTTSKHSGDEFAVYLDGTTPYVSYSTSRGVYQARMNQISNLTDMESFFNENQWIRLSPLIREDEFSDSNFLLTGYESEEERIKICKELYDSANKELQTLSQPSLEFSMDMANILALPEFTSLTRQFQLGNFVRVHIRDGYIKRARLLEVHLNFSDLSDFSCNFGNLITTKSEIDKHAELLSQAVTAGKQVATSAGDWQRAVDTSNSLEEEISNGLQNSAIEIGKASGQSITWNEQGIRCRKLIDGTTDQYEDEQIAIINNKIVFTNDSWKTSKAVVGEFTIDIDGNGKSETLYGLLADAVVSGYIKGSVIEGGVIKIGGTPEEPNFAVKENGEVTMRVANIDQYIKEEDVIIKINEILDTQTVYSVEVISTNSIVFNTVDQITTLECKVYSWGQDVTDTMNSTCFVWYKSTNDQESDVVFKSGVKTIQVTYNDMKDNAIFYCVVTPNEKGE